MRIDHIAYQRATKVAGLGLLLQLLMGIVLLFFGALADTTLFHAALYTMFGVIVWVSLLLVFHQHKLERLEALESDELQQQRAGGMGSAFEEEPGRFNVAARRLGLMHRWLMPTASWIMIILLAGVGAYRIWFLDRAAATGLAEFNIVSESIRGWALACCLAIAAVSFICSRFIAGMAKQEAWTNLRGGAGYMVGTALVTLAAGVGIVFTYFDNARVIYFMAQWVIPLFMILFAVEIFLNFILNLYRPRRAGEVPRPAYDSRILSLLSAPDSIVRSINEAVNYQFGFDITSSWGYQLLLRATRKLALLGAVVLVLLSCVVVVEPQQQALILRGGAIKRLASSGLSLKLPWPIETVEVYDVTRIRQLPLTVQLKPSMQPRDRAVLWSNPLDVNLGIEPFLVQTRLESDTSQYGQRGVTTLDDSLEGDATPAADIGRNYALVEGEFLLQYRIRSDGLEDYLNLSSEVISRRQSLDMRERMLKTLALREVTDYLSKVDLDAIIAEKRSQMVIDLRTEIQRVFDQYNTGIELLAVVNPWIRPAGEAAAEFERLSYNIAGAEEEQARALSRATQQRTATAGNEQMARRIAGRIDNYNLRANQQADQEELDRLETEILGLLFQAGGEASRTIALAKADQWLKVLGAESRREEFRGRRTVWHAGPEIYREWLLMDAISRSLGNARKYFMGIDPARFDIDVDILQDDSQWVVDLGSEAKAQQQQAGGSGSDR